MNCLTASAVPWNQVFPVSPGVRVAAKTYLSDQQNPVRKFQNLQFVDVWKNGRAPRGSLFTYSIITKHFVV